MLMVVAIRIYRGLSVIDVRDVPSLWENRYKLGIWLGRSTTITDKPFAPIHAALPRGLTLHTKGEGQNR